MRRTLILLIAVSIVILLSVFIVDSVSTLAGYLLNNSWLGVIGRWQSSEDPYSEIEFDEDGTYTEYYEGVRVRSGEYRAEGDTIVINYAPATCRGERSNGCVRSVRFEIGNKTLTLYEGEGKILYRKSKQARHGSRMAARNGALSRIGLSPWEPPEGGKGKRSFCGI